MTLPQALAPLAAYRQWIVFRIEPQPDSPKLQKRPCDWRTGAMANAQDPSNWVGYDEAVEAARRLGLHVGFVFTEHDPFWFVDIDNCLTPAGWSPLAQEICALLPGAAVEVSISGTGLHLIGVGKVPPHASRSPLGIELYTTARPMVLGTGAVGNAMQDCSEGMATLVTRYFERRAGVTLDVQWTTGPCPEWRGPTDDEDLVRRILASKRGAAAAFGAKASVQELWDADHAALSRAFPDARGYDASSADAALAQHLAFWTGKDCARIDRLMRMSKLARPKWNEHASYMQRTILQAVAQQKDVLADKPPEPPTVQAVTAPRDVAGETYLTPEDQKILFAGCVYISSEHAILMPGGSMLNEGRFNAMCGGYSYTLDRTAGKMAKSAWHAFVDSRDVRFPKVADHEFRPDLAPGHIWSDGGRALVNSYVPIEVPCKQGNPAPFLDHLARLLPDAHDRDILLAYMAALVQYPGRLLHWAPLLQGCEGNGKTLLSRCIIEAIGRPHCHTPKSSQLASRFNDWIDGKVFIAVEDLFPKNEDNSIIEALTPMLTNEFQEIEGKGSKKATRRVVANWMFNTNSKEAIRKKLDGRRFAIFYTAQQSLEDLKKHGMTGNYFPDLYSWLGRDGYAIVTHYLRNYAIPDALNPATTLHRAPTTSSTAEAIELGADALQEEILECINQGEVGFRGGWVSSHYLDKLIRDHKLEQKYPRHKRTAVMADIGYIPHPGLTNGQVHNPVAPDGKKPRLFIKVGHEAQDARGAEVARLYSEAQTSLLEAQGLHLAARAA